MQALIWPAWLSDIINMLPSQLQTPDLAPMEIGKAEYQNPIVA
jgi:hypothetical protein